MNHNKRNKITYDDDKGRHRRQDDRSHKDPIHTSEIKHSPRVQHRTRYDGDSVGGSDMSKVANLKQKSSPTHRNDRNDDRFANGTFANSHFRNNASNKRMEAGYGTGGSYGFSSSNDFRVNSFRNNGFRRTDSARFRGKTDGSKFVLGDRNFRGGKRWPLAKNNSNYDGRMRRSAQSERNTERTSRTSGADPSKPVMTLFHPTTVPRSGRYFEHDSRDTMEGGNFSRDRNYHPGAKRFQQQGYNSRAQPQRMYDPRADFGSSFTKTRKRVAPVGWRNQNFDLEDSKKIRAFNDANYGSVSTMESRSADADRVWVHDKFEMIEREENVDTYKIEINE